MRSLLTLALLPLLATCSRPPAREAPRSTEPPPGTTVVDSSLTVRVLDVGQGDAVLVTNGGSAVLIDGGPSPERLGRLLDSLGVGPVIDAVIISHAHYDHYNGLRALFESKRDLRVRYVFENGDARPTVTLRTLRDSIDARVRRGETIARDTDDPCADGRPVCTITLRGGARLQVLRPRPGASDANARSAPVRIVARDSTAFTMWLAGDAERDALAWFDATDYDRRPGMDVHVLKGGHHGSCDAIDARHLALTTPEAVIFSLAARNEYGHVHRQTTSLLERLGIPWYRTDRNGTITIRSPGAGGRDYSIRPSRGTANMTGPSDRRSTQPECRDLR